MTSPAAPGPHGLDHDRREGHLQLPDQRRQQLRPQRRLLRGPAPAECRRPPQGQATNSTRTPIRRCPTPLRGPGGRGTACSPPRHLHVLLPGPCQRDASGDGRGDRRATATPTPTRHRARRPPLRRRPPPRPESTRTTARHAPARNWFQERGSAETDNSVTIKRGERVAFAYPTGANYHNLGSRPGRAGVMPADQGRAGYAARPQQCATTARLQQPSRAGRAIARSPARGRTRSCAERTPR